MAASREESGVEARDRCSYGGEIKRSHLTIITFGQDLFRNLQLLSRQIRAPPTEHDSLTNGWKAYSVGIVADNFIWKAAMPLCTETRYSVANGFARYVCVSRIVDDYLEKKR
jgi:hypothetical protein